MPNFTKVGWLEAPCIILEPRVHGASLGVVKVLSLERKDNETTIVGIRLMPLKTHDRNVRITLPDSTYVTVVSRKD